jgi:hypothetical protein
MEMEKEKVNLALNNLLEKTEQGKLRWERTADKNTFLVVLEEGTISLSHTFPDRANFEQILDGGIYTMNFRDEKGEVIASVAISKSNTYSAEFEKTATIFEMAKKKVNQKVDRILEELAA